MELKDIAARIDVWENWRENYKSYVPRFIEEAINKQNWTDWNQDVFTEYFERSADQCIASLQQGYFNYDEKREIKENWEHIAPLLKMIAESQEVPLFDVYDQLEKEVLKHTQTRKGAAVHRMVAGLQPKLLTTIVSNEHLNRLYDLLRTGCNIELKGYQYNNWYKDSNLILKVFEEALPQYDNYELITYPWQTLEFLQGKNIKTLSMQIEQEKVIQLLKYKKQIILQGPPGTGKTKLAKELAKELTRPASITEADIKRLIQVGLTIHSVSDEIPYTVNSVSESGVSLRLENGAIKGSNYQQIIQAYTNLLENKPLTGGDAYHAAIAKYVLDNWTDDSLCKIIQFHPSYSYDDFVMGIVAKPNVNGEGILYEAENKLLGEFAKTALSNYLDSKKEVSILSKEHWVKERFLEFTEVISEKVDEENSYPLTDNVNINRVDEKSFYYKGKTWLGNPHRMPFKEIIQAYHDGNKERQDLINNNNLSGSAKQHASYYVRVLKLFIEFLKGKEYTENRGTEIKEKNHVLIIDEINRANLSSVLGELIYALEYRGEQVESMYEVDGSNTLILPPNLYIIGTMNTADRSVGHIDYAIRRRFAFKDVLPRDLTTELGGKFHKRLFDEVATLFDQNLSPEFEKKDVQLGHSYFINKSDEGGSMDVRLQYEIKPILLEYVKDGILIGDNIKQTIEGLKP